MSINISVHGSPLGVKKQYGVKKTFDNFGKNHEFQKRRQIRLQQVNLEYFSKFRYYTVAFFAFLLKFALYEVVYLIPKKAFFQTRIFPELLLLCLTYSKIIFLFYIS